MLAKKLFIAAVFLLYSLVVAWLLASKRVLLFLHPDFLPLAYFASAVMFVFALAIVFSRLHHHHFEKWSFLKMIYLLLPVILILVTDLKPLSSVAAIDRGLDTGALTIGRRVAVGQFGSKPENRTLYQWVIALNADPEPTHYQGQKVVIEGFVLRDPSMPAGQVAVAKFILTCCAADARVLSLPVLSEHTVLATLPNDVWVRVEGIMEVVEENGARQLVVKPNVVQQIPIPDNPYEI